MRNVHTHKLIDLLRFLYLVVPGGPGGDPPVVMSVLLTNPGGGKLPTCNTLEMADLLIKADS